MPDERCSPERSTEQIRGLPNLRTRRGLEKAQNGLRNYCAETLVRVIRLCGARRSARELRAHCFRELLSPGRGHPEAVRLERAIGFLAAKAFPRSGDDREELRQRCHIRIMAGIDSEDPAEAGWETRFFALFRVRARDELRHMLKDEKHRGNSRRFSPRPKSGVSRVHWEEASPDLPDPADDFVGEMLDRLRDERFRPEIERLIGSLPSEVRRTVQLRAEGHPIDGEPSDVPTPIRYLEDITPEGVRKRLIRAESVLLADPAVRTLIQDYPIRTRQEDRQLRKTRRKGKKP